MFGDIRKTESLIIRLISSSPSLTCWAEREADTQKSKNKKELQRKKGNRFFIQLKIVFFEKAWAAAHLYPLHVARSNRACSCSFKFNPRFNLFIFFFDSCCSIFITNYHRVTSVHKKTVLHNTGNIV